MIWNDESQLACISQTTVACQTDNFILRNITSRGGCADSWHGGKIMNFTFFHTDFELIDIQWKNLDYICHESLFISTVLHTHAKKSYTVLPTPGSFLFNSLKNLYTCTMYVNHNTPHSVKLCQSSHNFMFSFLITHWIKLVVPIDTWVRGNPWSMGNLAVAIPPENIDSSCLSNHQLSIVSHLHVGHQDPPHPLFWKV